MSKDDEDGAELWGFATKDVRRLNARATAAPPIRKPRIALKNIQRPVPAPVILMPGGGGIDRNTEIRIRKGDIKPEARLDLHGRTLEKARRDLYAFLQDAYARNKRCVLVITGKGRIAGEAWHAPGGGAIKRELPHWLDDVSVKTMILSVAPAAAKHGSNGAFYIYLRKNRGG